MQVYSWPKHYVSMANAHEMMKVITIGYNPMIQNSVVCFVHETRGNNQKGPLTKYVTLFLPIFYPSLPPPQALVVSLEGHDFERACGKVLFVQRWCGQQTLSLKNASFHVLKVASLIYKFHAAFLYPVYIQDYVEIYSC